MGHADGASALNIVCRHDRLIEESCKQCLGPEDWHTEEDSMDEIRQRVTALVEAKERGIDCDEDESAVIKRFLRMTHQYDHLALRTADAFPAEASEVEIGSDPGRGDPEPLG